MRYRFALLCVLFAAACGGDDPPAASKGDASVDARGAGAADSPRADLGPRDSAALIPDARLALDLLPDGPGGIPCSGACMGICHGLCAGLCTDRTAEGECHGPCAGICQGSCEGKCTVVARPIGGPLPVDAAPVFLFRDAAVMLDMPDQNLPLTFRDAVVRDLPSVTDGASDVPASQPMVDAAPVVDAPNLLPSPWTNRSARNSLSWPPATHAGAMAYDVKRDRVVMFGGWGDKTTAANATWEWDGANGTWTLRQQKGGPRPSRRFGHAVVFDPDRSKIVLVGGVDETGSTNAEIWEWDGETETWLQRGTGPMPSRWGHAMVWDDKKKRILLFGGSHRKAALGDVDLFDLWQYDGTTWKNLTYPLPPAWPRPRRGHGFAFDSERGVAVLYGGELGEQPFYSADLWEWDSEKGLWTDRTPIPLPAAWPGYRSFFSLSAAAGRVTLFGNYLPNLWTLSPASGVWNNATPAVLPMPWPGARDHSTGAVDTKRNVLVISGGGVPWGRGELADTWERASP